MELSAKTRIYFATAVALWDADFYVKVDDDVHVNIGNGVLSFYIFLSGAYSSLLLLRSFLVLLKSAFN